MKIYITTKEAAEYLGISYWTMRDWRKQGKGPDFVKIGQRIIRYRVEDLDAWVRSSATKTG